MSKEYDQKAVANRMKMIRTQKGFSQEDVAQDLGISRSFYAALENGIKRVSLENAAAFSRLYGVGFDWLIHGDADGNVYGNVHGNVYQNVPSLPARMEDVANQYGGVPHLLRLLKSKEETITALMAENQALKEVISLLKRHLPDIE